MCGHHNVVKADLRLSAGLTHVDNCPGLAPQNGMLDVQRPQKSIILRIASSRPCWATALTRNALQSMDMQGGDYRSDRVRGISAGR